MFIMNNILEIIRFVQKTSFPRLKMPYFRLPQLSNLTIRTVSSDGPWQEFRYHPRENALSCLRSDHYGDELGC